MSDIYKNRSVDLTTTDNTVVYTVPTANVAIVPAQKPVQGIIKSIHVCNDTGGAVTLTVTNEDSSVGSAIKITSVKSIAANADVELLSAPMVVEDGDVIKAQAGSGNALHVILSVLEIS